MKIYLWSTGHKRILGMTIMYIEFDHLEIDLRNVCTLTAVYCMFTNVHRSVLFDEDFLSKTNISLVSAKSMVAVQFPLDNDGQQQCQCEEL